MILLPTHRRDACAVLVLIALAFAHRVAPAIADNPVLPGFYADPSIVITGGRLYLYATKDPWGAEDLACFSTQDFQTWTPHTLNWPTKAACHSDTSGSSKVWAPSVVRAPDGRYIMYVSVGSEIYCGVADHPTGPWKNLRDDGTPLVRARQYNDAVHSIDAEAFIDDDGRAYLYWGSGFNWVNGHCMFAELNKDMRSFATEPRDITPPNYFEGPFMLKRAGRYYLTYSEGKTTDDTYKVRYAIADAPGGPFTEEGPNSPILRTNAAREILGPGHHCIFALAGADTIAYHRHARPFDAKTIKRQICFDRLTFDEAGAIERVEPTDEGVELAPLAP